GSPVVAHGTVYTGVVDLGPGTGGGVVAVDGRTGAVRWRHTTGASVRNAAAGARGKVVFATHDGVRHAVNATAGAEAWAVPLGATSDSLKTWLYAAPSVDDGNVYIGNEAEVAALSVDTGAKLWSFPGNDPVFGFTLATAAVGGGVGVTVV